MNCQIFTQKKLLCIFLVCVQLFFSLKVSFYIKDVCRTLSFASGFLSGPDWGGRWCLRACWPTPAWFTLCACLIWTWTITQLKKGKHISYGSFEVELEEQEPRRCAGLFCISFSHVSVRTAKRSQDTDWPWKRRPGLYKSQLQMFSCSETDSRAQIFYSVSVRFSITIWWQ